MYFVFYSFVYKGAFCHMLMDCLEELSEINHANRIVQYLCYVHNTVSCALWSVS